MRYVIFPHSSNGASKGGFLEMIAILAIGIMEPNSHLNRISVLPVTSWPLRELSGSGQSHHIGDLSYDESTYITSQGEEQ